MKKTLIIILLTIMMSAGLYFSADSVSAEEVTTVPISYDLSRDGNTVEFTSNYDNLSEAIIEYTFYSNDILMSQLIKVDVKIDASVIGSTDVVYTFELPEDALSFKIWRVISENKKIMSLSGSFEHEYGGESSISDVETRIKTIYIEDDLITREVSIGSMGGMLTNQYTFKMHFNLTDINGNTIPVDTIHSLKVEYDVHNTYLLGLIDSNVTHVVKNIKATETRNATVWPYIIPESVIRYIDESIDENYDWQVTLGTFRDADSFFPVADVKLDQTSILTISYYYNDVFYENETVVDEPYDEEDIIDVIPNTTIEIESYLDLILSQFDNLESTFKIMIGILGLIAVAVIIFVIIKVFKSILWMLKSIIWFFKMIYKLLKFIVIQIPKGIIDFIIFLVVPSKKRKERNNVSRYL